MTFHPDIVPSSKPPREAFGKTSSQILVSRAVAGARARKQSTEPSQPPTPELRALEAMVIVTMVSELGTRIDSWPGYSDAEPERLFTSGLHGELTARLGDFQR
ncbi:hypothetical protein HIM_08320 [Hirsutella minnesotensis 3608]|uniref:Uncharacterized protein n=1 Tax=Hirsutella minnesotensis 3608 TaxID=1043627 RepID=A0A0F8A3R3_9HYPO|nr:hypothetical protein HIM_08320 [Hirsutella minnesotensis 3608]